MKTWLRFPPVVWAWLLGGLLFRGVVAWGLPPGFDEAYYYLYSRHLSWSYFDHPPIAAWTTGLGWWLTGWIAPLTIRVGALLLYTASVALLYRTAVWLFDDRTGILTVAIASLTPLFWIAFGTLTAPDNGLIFFWTLTLYLSAREFIPPPNSRLQPAGTDDYRPSYRIALIGLAVGLACLSKYHGFILGAGLVGFCATNGRSRRALGSPWIGVALGLCALALVPVLIWNSQHDWISFRFQLSARFEGTPAAAQPFQWLQVLSTWLVGVAYLFPSIGFLVWAALGRSLLQQARHWVQPPFTLSERRQRDRDALILWLSVPIAVGFTLLGGKQPIYPAWPAPGLWGITLLLAAWASQWRGVVVRRWLLTSGAAIATLALVAFLHVTVGLLQKPGNYSLFGGFVAPSADGSTALIDVMQLRSRVAADAPLLAALRDTDFIFTDEFYLSAYVDMALRPLLSQPITCFSQDPRGFAFWDRSGDWVGQSAVYLTLASLHPSIDEAAAEFAPEFDAIAPLDEITLTRGGEPVETLWAYRATALQRPYAFPYP